MYTPRHQYPTTLPLLEHHPPHITPQRRHSVHQSKHIYRIHSTKPIYTPPHNAANPTSNSVIKSSTTANIMEHSRPSATYLPGKQHLRCTYLYFVFFTSICICSCLSLPPLAAFTVTRRSLLPPLCVLFDLLICYTDLPSLLLWIFPATWYLLEIQIVFVLYPPVEGTGGGGNADRDLVKGLVVYACVCEGASDRGRIIIHTQERHYILLPFLVSSFLCRHLKTHTVMLAGRRLITAASLLLRKRKLCIAFNIHACLSSCVCLCASCREVSSWEWMFVFHNRKLFLLFSCYGCMDRRIGL